MHRIALRTAARPAARSLRTATTKRFASTASPADRPRSWKSSALRWGLAGAALYYYNTSTVFADEMPSRTVDAPPTFADDDLPTVDSVIEQKRKQVQSKIETQLAKQPEKSSPAEPTKADALSTTPEAKGNEASPAVAVEGGAGALQEEADQQGAFNPETGEINWDCPCLGGMAHGPCGEEFKTAFSCFVYSNEEPKGMDCIEKFQGMQECFRQYPEIYGAELADEEEAAAQDALDGEPPVAEYQKAREDSPSINAAVGAAEHKLETDNLPGATPANGEVPAKWEDATEANVKEVAKPKEKQDEKEDKTEKKE